MQNFFFFLTVFLLCIKSVSIFSDQHLEDTQSQSMKKLLVLITASDDLQVYVENQKIWRAYMHLDPEHVEAYFIKANPNLESKCEVCGDVFWCKTGDVLFPGVMNKTVSALEYFLPRMHEFDYVLRTNLSSFYVFPRLLEFLKQLPRSGCYCGSKVQYNSELSFVSGSGYILSADVAASVANYSGSLYDVDNFDDVVMGYYCRSLGLDIIPADYVHISTLDEWVGYSCKLPEKTFQFRCKYFDPNLRHTHEIYIQNELLKKFYGKTIF